MQNTHLQINKYLRRGVIGMLAGAYGSLLLGVAIDNGLARIAVGMLIAVGYTLAFRPRAHAYAENIMSSAFFGVALWAALSIIVLPLLAGQSPQWTAAGMQQHFPELVGWTLYGATTGLLAQILNDLAFSFLGPEYQPKLPEPVIKTRIVIAGGGFAGVMAAEKLEKLFKADPSVAITIVSDTNSLLFTPMLTEVAGGSLEPTHISNPLRSSLHRTQVVYGQVVSIDSVQKHIQVTTKENSSDTREIPFDHLVMALGSVSNYLGLTGIEENAFDFKSLEDAIRVRDRVITMLEFANQEPDPLQRQAQLTFVIAGAGFAGAELAGALNDFIRGALPYYPMIDPAEVRIIVVHSRAAILPELPASLAAYALEKMKARGVIFKLNTRLLEARGETLLLQPQEEIRAATLVWTAGVMPHPLMRTLPAEQDKRGAIVVENTLAVPGIAGLWALGDCARVPDIKTGEACPPTAQFALREAKTVASNIYASVHHKPLHPFYFDAIGILCVIGHQTACAEIKGLHFSGFFAWILWRGIYLSKLPGLERKLRVLTDWIVELFFPRDIVQTIHMKRDLPIKNSAEMVTTSEK